MLVRALKVTSNVELYYDLQQLLQCRLPIIFVITDDGVQSYNDQPSFESPNTTFARLHNTFAKELHKLHPKWSNKSLRQETQRVIKAIWQSIVLNEYLPVVLGKQEFNRHFAQRSEVNDSSSNFNSSNDEGKSFSKSIQCLAKPERS